MECISVVYDKITDFRRNKNNKKATRAICLYSRQSKATADMSCCYQMSNNDTSSEFNDFTCEGFGCYAKATRKVCCQSGV
jgi:hypothetical protein